MTQIRKFIPIPSDYQQIVSIENALFPEDEATVENWKWQDQQYPPTAVFSRWVGEMDGQIVSHGYFTQEDSTEQGGHFQMHIAVHPQHQKRGYGSEMFVHMQRLLHAHAPSTIMSRVNLNYPNAADFLRHRNFEPLPHKVFYRLALAGWQSMINPAPLISGIETLGIKVFSLTDLMNQGMDWKNQYFKLEKRISEETEPDMDAFPDTLELFDERFLHSEEFNPASIFIARYQQHWIATAGLRQSPQKRNAALHGITGVDKPYRRNGIATLLHLYCIRYALDHGVEYLESEIWHGNPLEKIQQKLGYQKQPWQVYQRIMV